MKHIAKTPGKGQRGTAQVLLIIYRHKGPYVKGKILILDVQKTPPLRLLSCVADTQHKRQTYKDNMLMDGRG